MASAADAAAPGQKEFFRRCEGANVSVHIKSHNIGRAPDQGMSVGPSGLFPSPLIKPVGSRIAGTPTLRRVWAIISLTA